MNKVVTFIFLLLKRLVIFFNQKNVFIGKGSIIDYNVKIYNNKNVVTIGKNVYLRGKSKGYHTSMSFPTTLLLDVKNAVLNISDNCRLNGVYIHAQKHIEIGKNCVIAAGVNIIDSNGHELKSNDRTKGRDLPEAIIIGENVWIGINAIILKGTKIGDNSVISAGSIVRGKFEENSLVIGNPAICVKKIII